MKYVSLLLLFVGLNASAITMEQMEDTQVSAQLVETLSRVASKDGNVSARLLTVYRGGAAGMTSIIVNLFDKGPTLGDYGNVTTYELAYFSGEPKELSLIKLKEKKYRLSFTAPDVDLDEKTGDFKYTKRRISLDIVLESDGAITSVTMK